jgi:hypothetical protein
MMAPRVLGDNWHSCEIVKLFDAKLAEKNTMFVRSFFDGNFNIETCKIKSGVRGPAVRATATYCPFCGALLHGNLEEEGVEVGSGDER